MAVGDKVQRIDCLASRSDSGLVALGAFLAKRLELRLRLQFLANDEKFGFEPLGPDTRMAVVGTGDPSNHGEVVQAICTAPCPVLAVPSQAARLWASPTRALRNYDRVLTFGDDGSEASAAGLAEAVILASRLLARVLAVRIHPEGEPALRSLQGAVAVHSMLGASWESERRETLRRCVPRDTNGCRIDFCRRHGPVGETLDQLATRSASLMIVIGSDGLEPGQFALRGSLTRELLLESAHPLVVVPGWWRPCEPPRPTQIIVRLERPSATSWSR